MLKRYRIFVALALWATIGCQRDPDLGSVSSSDSSTITLSIESFSEDLIGSTRAAGSATSINRGFILFYNSSTGAYKGYESMEGKTITESGSTITFEVGDSFSFADKVICIFNHDQSAELPSDFSVVTSDNVDAYFPISASYLAEIEEDMNSSTYSLGMPMCVNDFTDSDRSIREVYRSVARMELFIKEGLTIEYDNQTLGVGVDNLRFAIVNESTIGSVGFTSLSASIDALQGVENLFDASSTLDFPHSLTQYSSEASDTSNKIYLQEYPYSTMAINGDSFDGSTFDEGRLAIMLRHGDPNSTSEADQMLYYKLNLLDKVASTYYDVERNHNYRVVITAVNSRGYSTLKEAYQMPASNIEYQIYDDQGGLIYSNGQYAIAMDDILSYDEVLVYGSNETIIEFNNIRYVLPEGGEMDGVTFDTNQLTFDILSDQDGLIVNTSSDFTFDSNGNSQLTSQGQSITITLSGEGECTIALKILLGNLEMGSDEITIKKIATNGDGDGSFDAHPNQLELTGQQFVEGSWQSDNIDFGARDSSSAYGETDGGTVIYMGENVTPTGYRTMDGYVSGESAKNSYPVYSPKTRKGYYSYVDEYGETHKVMIQLNQLAPFYLGHFGNTAADTSLHHYDGLLCEKIEEIEGGRDADWNLLDINGVITWGSAYGIYYNNIYSDGRYHNLVDGLTITKYIVEQSSSVGVANAAIYCYMKNDVNGDGYIDPDTEPINWYLPAQNQLMAMWINKIAFSNDPDYSINTGDNVPYYWSCSEVDNLYYGTPATFNQYVISLNVLEGETALGRAKMGDEGHIRCVRGVN